MVEPYDLETNLEDALVTLIGELTSVKTIRAEDITETNLSPGFVGDVIKVQVVSSVEEPGTINLYPGSTMLVDIAVFASKRRDLASRHVNRLRGVIREVFSQSDIVDRINAFGTILVYSNGVIPIDSFDATDEKNYGKGITVQVVAHPKI